MNIKLFSSYNSWYDSINITQLTTVTWVTVSYYQATWTHVSTEIRWLLKLAITTTVAPSGEWYEVKAGMVSLQCNSFKCELLTMGRYTNPASFTFLLQLHAVVIVNYCQKSRGTGSRPEWVPFPFLPFLSLPFLPLPFHPFPYPFLPCP